MVAPEVVLTNCHVLLNATSIRVVSDVRPLLATIISSDIPRDLCSLHVTGLTAPVAETGKSSSLRIGQRMYAIGSPKGLERTLSDGLLSAIRQIDNHTFLQISAPITHGSSGGGLFSESGKLVGITSNGIDDGQNLNFAIPIDDAKLADLTAPARQATVTKVPVEPPQISNQVVVSLQGRLRLYLMKTDKEPPRYHFTDIHERIQYLYWVAEMSERLKSTIVDTDARTGLIQTVWYEARYAGLDPGLVLGLVKTESNFNHFYEKNGRLGLLGIGKKWAVDIGDGNIHRLYDVQTNLRYGCAILRMYIDINNGDLFLALGQYDSSFGRATFPNKVLHEWKTFEYRA